MQSDLGDTNVITVQRKYMAYIVDFTNPVSIWLVRIETRAQLDP